MASEQPSLVCRFGLLVEYYSHQTSCNITLHSTGLRGKPRSPVNSTLGGNVFQGIVIAALFLVGAPVSGWLLTSIGCAGASPFLGAFCGHNSYIPLFGFTVAVWLALVAGIALRSGRRS